MVQAAKQHNETEDAPKRQILNSAACYQLELPDLVTKGSLSFFKKLGLSTAFLDEDPATWPLCKNYCMAVNTDNTMTVTNDHAERGVALKEKFNRALTHTEEQAQYLLQVVSDRRKKFPNCKKFTLN